MSVGAQLVGDSTGATDVTGWFSVWGAWLGTQFPGYTVKYQRFFVHSRCAVFGPVTTIQQGTLRGGGPLRWECPTTGDTPYSPAIVSGAFPMPTGDWDVRVFKRFDQWPSSGDATLVGKWTAGQLSMRFAFRSDRKLDFYYSTDGTTQLQQFSTAATTFNLGDIVGLRVTYDADNGASGRDIKFWVSTNDGATWSQLGSTLTVAGAATIYTGSTSAWEIFGYGTTINARGNATYRVEIRDGIDGTLVNPQPVDAWTANQGNIYVTGAPELWLINSSVSGWSVDDFNGTVGGTSTYSVPAARWLPKFQQQVCFVSLNHNDRGATYRGETGFAKFDTLCGKIRTELATFPALSL